ncbi:hypothetical protein TNIN_165781 [Trichonephila inaurata madagascariensis]|uniref:Uncharacterized protein n=1 Tax=Trichonephila inaurata madagascariensis TaxID=2747483 RepID=A0A8X6XYB0_9ARAC|nr:hypothetical protein TNIN_165781 [Trichonephila inaurata madagascariensis]
MNGSHFFVGVAQFTQGTLKVTVVFKSLNRQQPWPVAIRKSATALSPSHFSISESRRPGKRLVIHPQGTRYSKSPKKESLGSGYLFLSFGHPGPALLKAQNHTFQSSKKILLDHLVGN